MLAVLAIAVLAIRLLYKVPAVDEVALLLVLGPVVKDVIGPAPAAQELGTDD